VKIAVKMIIYLLGTIPLSSELFINSERVCNFTFKQLSLIEDCQDITASQGKLSKDQQQLSNYIPIALLPILSKILGSGTH
jgi:hypothetical protein